MKRFLVPFTALVLVAVPFVHGADAASSATCMGHKVDIKGTDKADQFVVHKSEDRNGDGWVAYAGGKGNDSFLQDPSSNPVTNVVACGYAGDDYFGGLWTQVDGGSGNDYASLYMCVAWPGGMDYPIRKTEFVDPRQCPDNLHW